MGELGCPEHDPPPLPNPVLMQLGALSRYCSNAKGLGRSFLEGNKMEEAGSGAEEGRGRAGAVPPSLEPVPGEIHFCVNPRRRPGRFIYILVRQSKGTKRPGMALPRVTGG